MGMTKRHGCLPTLALFVGISFLLIGLDTTGNSEAHFFWLGLGIIVAAVLLRVLGGIWGRRRYHRIVDEYRRTPNEDDKC